MANRFLLLSYLLLPFLLFAGEQNPPLPNPYTLKEGWWNTLLNHFESSNEIDGMRKIVDFLHHLKMNIPPHDQETIAGYLTQISENIDRFLTYRHAQTIALEPTPPLRDSYSIEELLLLAQTIKEKTFSLLSLEGELKRVQRVQERTLIQIDELYSIYEESPPSSLERLTLGFKLIVAVSYRAVIDERIRLLEEQFFISKQATDQAKEFFILAEPRLSSQSIDRVTVESTLLAAKKKLNDLEDALFQAESTDDRKTAPRKQIIAMEEKTADEGELVNNLEQQSLQFEVGCVLNCSKDPLDTTALVGLLKLITYAKTKIEIYSSSALLALVTLLQGAEETIAKELFQEGREWMEELERMEGLREEWGHLARQQQDNAQASLLHKGDEQVPVVVDQEKLLNHQRKVQESLVALSSLESDLFQAKLLTTFVANRSLAKVAWWSGFSDHLFFSIEQFYLRVVDLLSYPLFWLNERPITLFKLLRSALLLLLAILLSRFLRRMIERVATRKQQISPASLYAFNRVTHYLILSLGLAWALTLVGIDLSNLLIIAGALSVGIGFGLQAIVNNFIGGLIILFDRKLRIGDMVELSGGEVGHITEVNIQNTVIRTLKGHDILVPNSEIITRQLTNWTLRDDFARFHIPFGVAYGSEKERVKSVVEEAARKVEGTVVGHPTLPDPSVWLVGFGDSALNFELVVWVSLKAKRSKRNSITSAYYWEIDTALQEEGIEIPFPQREVRMRSPKPKRALAEMTQ